VKKILLLVLGVMLVGSMVFGQTTQVLSRNAVGYVKISAPRGGLTLARNDFISLAGNPTPSNLFGLSTFPIGTKLYIWDNIGARYNLELLSSNAFTHIVKWSPNTSTLSPGHGFWIAVPGTAASNIYEGFIMGEVPDKNTSPTARVDIVTGINMFGYPYPSEVRWTNTQLAKSAQIGDTLFTWNGSSYQQNIFTSNAFTHVVKWSNTNQVLMVGQGYWFKRVGSSLSSYETKPYTWP